jgi:predicted nucleic-acid-binding Zn-ribbon protein
MFGLERKPIKHIESEKWYIAVDCAKCCVGIAFAEAPPQRSDPLQRRTISNLKCPHCGYVDTYAPAVMSTVLGLSSRPGMVLDGKSTRKNRLHCLVDANKVRDPHVRLALFNRTADYVVVAD